MYIYRYIPFNLYSFIVNSSQCEFAPKFNKNNTKSVLNLSIFFPEMLILLGYIALITYFILLA